MPSYKNPITIVQGEQPSENRPCLSYADSSSSSSSTSIQTASGSWLYTQSSYGHGILRTNPTTNLSVELNNANTYRIIVKFKVDELQNRDMVLWYCASERIGVGTANYVFTDSSGYGFSLLDYTIDANKWYYAVVYKDNLTAANILTLSVYDDSGVLIICGAFAKNDMTPTINRTFLLGGQDGYQQLKAIKTNIELNEFVMEKDSIAVWGETNSKTKNMGVFHFGDWSEFTEVEYIQFPSGSYIDTKIAPTNHSTEIKVFDDVYVNDKHWIGTDGSVISYHFTTFNNTYYWGLVGGEGHYGTWTSGMHVLRYNDDANHSVVLDGQTIGSGTNISSTANLLIGRRSNTSNFTGKVYYTIIKDKNTDSIVRNLKPCYHTQSGIIGMFDMVNNKFYTNAGTGKFIKGPDVNI